MKCGRVQLQERTKLGHKDASPITSDKPRRFCQKRLVNPDHEEDPRWIDLFERFHCNEPANITIPESSTINYDSGEHELFLSVQTLQFKGVEQHRKRPRTGFKYKTVADSNMHRMFVRQVVTDEEPVDVETSSQLTCYYYDDYAKYLTNAERSRPSSEKSNIYLQGVGTKLKVNKAVQVDLKSDYERKTRKPVRKDTNGDPDIKKVKDLATNLSNDKIKDTKISFHHFGKRKSLTISRTQSPETMQVIRVDVVCNSSTSSPPADYEYKPTKEIIEKLDKKTETVQMKNYQFANKYILTNTMKTLEENVSGGARVTLLCKTFRLTDRSRIPFNKKSLDIKKMTSNCSKLKLAK